MPTENYLNQTVYHRKGTNIILPQTQANASDPNLAPITVSQAIQLGYMEDPLKKKSTFSAEQQALNELREQNRLLIQQIKELENSSKQTKTPRKTRKVVEQKPDLPEVVIPEEELLDLDEDEDEDDVNKQLNALLG
jgi:hypothetical protein